MTGTQTPERLDLVSLQDENTNVQITALGTELCPHLSPPLSELTDPACSPHPTPNLGSHTTAPPLPQLLL